MTQVARANQPRIEGSRWHLLAAAGVASAALALSGCGSSGETPPSPAPSSVAAQPDSNCINGHELLTSFLFPLNQGGLDNFLSSNKATHDKAATAMITAFNQQLRQQGLAGRPIKVVVDGIATPKTQPTAQADIQADVDEASKVQTGAVADFKTANFAAEAGELLVESRDNPDMVAGIGLIATDPNQPCGAPTAPASPNASSPIPGALI